MCTCVTKANWKTLSIYVQVEKTLVLPEMVSKGEKEPAHRVVLIRQIKLLYDYAPSNYSCSVQWLHWL